MSVIIQKTLFFLICAMGLFAQAGAVELGAERAIALVKSGQILPLQEILQRQPELADGRILDIQLEQGESGEYLYEIELLKAGNEVVELDVNAATGELLREEFED